METFPIASLSRSYALGTPQWRIVDTGVASQQAGPLVLYSRERLPEPRYAVDIRFEALTAADMEILEEFAEDNRIAEFEWTDYATDVAYVAIFDPDSPSRPAPSPVVPGAYDVQYTLLVVRAA